MAHTPEREAASSRPRNFRRIPDPGTLGAPSAYSGRTGFPQFVQVLDVLREVIVDAIRKDKASRADESAP
jgi:hypothetical protein